MRQQKIIRQIISFLKKWFWINPTKKDDPLKATDVISHWVIVDYKGQYINLRKHELPMWNALSRSEKRAMANKTAQKVKKGKIRFEKINGKMTCIKNKDYGKDNGK